MNVHGLALNYWRKTKDDLAFIYGRDTKIDKEKFCKWIGYWGNGGGMLSIENDFKNFIIANSKTVQEFLDEVESTTYFDASIALLFSDIVKSMFDELLKKKSGRKSAILNEIEKYLGVTMMFPKNFVVMKDNIKEMLLCIYNTGTILTANDEHKTGSRQLFEFDYRVLASILDFVRNKFYHLPE